MIDPGIDTGRASEAEIVAAYMASGMSRHDAEVYTAAIVGRDSRFLFD